MARCREDGRSGRQQAPVSEGAGQGRKDAGLVEHELETVQRVG